MVNMLRKRINKNKLSLYDSPNPYEQRMNLSKEVLRDNTFFPKTVEYKDIDEAFTKWVEEELRIVFEDEVLPTYALFSNQRFTEYMQMWSNVDENRNVKMNFKTITRDNNPRENSLYGKTGNIPTNEKFLMKRVESINEQGKKCYIDYKMSQPVTVDLLYRVTLVTNKYELLNEVNTLVRDKFKSIQSYLFVNGHAMPMKLNTVSDNSDYTVDDRQYFSQTFEIGLIGYIITEDDFEISINPIVKLSCINIEGGKNKAVVEIEEIDECDKEGPEYLNQRVKLTITFQPCDSLERKFIMDSEMLIEYIEKKNIRKYTLRVNDENIKEETNIRLKEGDEVYLHIYPINRLKVSEIKMEGFNPDEFIHKTIIDENIQEIEVE